jgi:hypothetical protein
MNKIKYFLYKYFSCCFLNHASQNIVPVDSHVKIITDDSPQNMSRIITDDFRVYDKDNPNSNSNSVNIIISSNSNSVNIINSNRKKYIIPRSRSHSISPIDTPVNSFRVFSNSFVRTNSQCDLCRETSALTHSKIYCSHEINNNENEDIIYF